MINLSYFLKWQWRCLCLLIALCCISCSSFKQLQASENIAVSQVEVYVFMEKELAVSYWKPGELEANQAGLEPRYCRLRLTASSRSEANRLKAELLAMGAVEVVLVDRN